MVVNQYIKSRCINDSLNFHALHLSLFVNLQITPQIKFAHRLRVSRERTKYSSNERRCVRRAYLEAAGHEPHIPLDLERSSRRLGRGLGTRLGTG
ncbi:hypothetical protein BVI2075_450032 [Burkholderia vietnamiensis]|nr:hypothetical protein BVI2075_450032 [Burkholderia vietnamiensis]